MKWSPQQDDAMKAVSSWLKAKKGPQTFYLAGYAGTGKTTLVNYLAGGVSGTVLYGAFTGKAALVMQTKGCAGASTIHSMIYRIKDKNAAVPEFVLNHDGPVRDADLVVIDEVSMVGEDLGKDLLSFGKKVLVLGDPEQLPPVRGEGFFTSRQPDFMLTEIHRQAAENPIVAMSMKVRTGGRLEVGEYGTSRVVPRTAIDADDVLAADQILVGLNRTRRLYNGRIRNLLGFQTQEFEKTDRVVCLKNKADRGLLNGSLWEVKKIAHQTKDQTTMHVVPIDAGFGDIVVEVQTPHAFIRGEERSLDWRERRSMDEFDFGYALTCHKAQGSQWDDVIVFDESAAFREEARRWTYTALTRAAERVTVVI